MLVKEIMTDNIRAAKETNTLLEAAIGMRAQGIGFLPVVSEDSQRLVGVLTDRDIVVKGLGEGRNLRKTPCREIATRSVATCNAADPVSRAAELMCEFRVRRLLVQDETGRLVGVLSIGDIAASDTPDAETGRILATVCSELTSQTTSQA